MKYMSECELMREFADNLRSILDEYKMTQNELAEETGIPKSAISHYLSGQRLPSIKSLVNIVYVLECDVEDLINFDYMIS